MSQVKWLSIAEKKKPPRFIFKRSPFLCFGNRSYSSVFLSKVTSLASGLLSAVCPPD